MANTTNFNWETPDDTDLVKDGAAAIRTLGSAIDTSLVDLKGGTTGQILSKTSNTDMDFTWIANDVGDITAVSAGTGISGGGTSGAITITNSMATEITAAGDIIVGTGSGTFDNLPIGTTGQVLTADTTVSPYKVKWATAASGSTFVGCSLYKNANQTVNNATNTAITFQSESYDTDGFHDTSTNTSRITIPAGKAGKYLVTGSIAWSTGANERVAMIYKNGSLVNYMHQMYPDNAGGYYAPFNYVINLTVGDYIELFCYQGSGGSLTVYNGLDLTTFQASYLGA
jgi:hypothetical protein